MKSKLFECMGGNSFRMATPQPMGMMAEMGQEQGQGHKVRLTLARKVETNEWLVKVYIDGKYQEGPTYYTDDKQDAIGTAKSMMQWYVQQGYEMEKGKTHNLGKTHDSISQEFGEVAPPGGEKVVKALKKKGNVDNPWAVAWSMKNKGQI